MEDGWAFLGRLAFGPNPLGVPGRKIGRVFLGWLAFGPNPFRALRLGWLVKGAGPGPMVPTRPIIWVFFFFFSKKKKRVNEVRLLDFRKGGVINFMVLVGLSATGMRNIFCAFVFRAPDQDLGFTAVKVEARIWFQL